MLVNDLTGQYCSIVDTATVASISDAPLNECVVHLAGGRSDYAFLANKLMKDEKMRQALLFLSRTLYFDFLAVDSFAKRQIESSISKTNFSSLVQSQLLKEFEIPFETLKKVYTSVYSSLHESSGQVENFLIRKDHEDDEYFEMHFISKILGDDSLIDLASHADSMRGFTADIPLRAYFYFALASDIKVPLFLSPFKTEILWKIANSFHLKLSSLSLLSENIKEALDEQQKSLKNKYLFRPCLEFEEPPIYKEILRNAVSKKLSLLDSTLEIRDSENCKAFREIMAELQRDFQYAGPTAALANNKLEKLSDVIRAWLKTGDIKEGTEKVKRKISLQELPFGIGQVFKILDMKELNINDPILVPNKEQRFLFFVSDWFR